MTKLNKILDIIVSHKILWILLWCISIMSLWDITAMHQLGWSMSLRLCYALSVAAFKSSILVLIFDFLSRWKSLKILALIFIGIYALLAILNFLCFYFYEFGISRKLILILAQTTSAESRESIPGILSNIESLFSSFETFVCLAIIAAMIVGARHCGRKIFNSIAWTMSIAGFIALTIFSVKFSSGRTAHSLVLRIIKYTNEVIESDRQFKELLAQRRPLDDAKSITSTHASQNVVVIIGESASRNHHSLYGYPLPTTPHLDQIADSLYVFTDAIGSSASTSGNMERILSFKRDDATCGDGLNYPLVIDVFNQAGYRTFWLSNQERTGSVSNTSGVMTYNASEIKYIGAENSEDALTVRFDESLLPYLTDALQYKTEYRLIFLHLLGSHAEYSYRYPPTFAKFSAEDEFSVFNYSWLTPKSAKRRAEYDNSILYTDSLLAKIIKMLGTTAEPSIMIYFSDHGENVYDRSGTTGRGKDYVEVPFIVYANQAWQRTNPELTIKISEAVGRPLSTANVAHTLLTLTGTSYSHYDPTCDVLSDDYAPGPRYVDEVIWHASDNRQY